MREKLFESYSLTAEIEEAFKQILKVKPIKICIK